MVTMRHLLAFAVSTLLIAACANSEVSSVPPDSSTLDAAADVSVKDSSTPKDSGGGKDAEAKKDSGGDDATLADSSTDADLDATTDAGDAGVDAADAMADASDGSVVVLDGGTGNDTCLLAIGLSSGVPVSGDTTSATDDYDVNVNISNVCDQTDLSFYQFDGRDVAYSISVPTGKTLTAVVAPTTQWDPALALVTDCSNIGPTCVGGDDFNGSGDPETGTYTNNTGQTQTIFIVVDAYSSSEYGPFTLNATVQ